jgi:hypothetical protein
MGITTGLVTCIVGKCERYDRLLEADLAHGERVAWD